MAEYSSLLRPHHLEIKDLEIGNFGVGDTDRVSYSIQQYVEININMSLFHKAIEGEIVLFDGYGIHHLLPLIGEEILTFSFRSDNREWRQFRGRITSMKNMQYSDTYDSLTYTLTFVSEVGWQNIVAYPLDYYVDQSPLAALQQIYKKLGVSQSIETFNDEYAENVKVLFPKVSPFDAVDMVVSRTYSKDSSQASAFYVFEDLQGIKFCNVENMMDQTYQPQNGINYYFDYTERYDADPATATSRKNEHYRIINTTFYERFNTVNKFVNGAIDVEYIRFNMLTKQLKNYKSWYRDTSKQHNTAANVKTNSKTKFIGKNTDNFLTLYQGRKDNKVGYFAHQDYGIQDFSGKFELESSVYAKTSGFLHSMMESIFDIEIPGNTDRRVGDVINLPYVPRGTLRDSSTSNLDYYMSGRFIVIGIRHVMSPISITSILTLAKPYFEKNIETYQGDLL